MRTYHHAAHRQRVPFEGVRHGLAYDLPLRALFLSSVLFGWIRPCMNAEELIAIDNPAVWFLEKMLLKHLDPATPQPMIGGVLAGIVHIVSALHPLLL